MSRKNPTHQSTEPTVAIIPLDEDCRINVEYDYDAESDPMNDGSNLTGYTVVLEERVFLVGHTKGGEIVSTHEWLELDSLSGCYLDGSYAAADVVQEHFDTTSLSAEALAVLESRTA